MSAESPQVSIVMGTRNAARWLAEALGSIRRGGVDDVEIVVVDAASADDTVAIAKSFGAEVLQQRGTGLFGAWNEGVEAARGELIGFLDSDDRWEPGKLAAQVRVLSEHPELDYVIGHVRFFLEPGMPEPPGLRPELIEGERPAPMPGVLLARRAVFERIGPFRIEYGIASDIDWFARLGDSELRGEVVPAALIHKRVHDSNLSHFQAENMNAEILTLLRESIARKRAGA